MKILAHVEGKGLRDYLISERGWTLFYDVASFREYRKGPLQLECESFDGDSFWKIFNKDIGFRSDLVPVLEYLHYGASNNRVLNHRLAYDKLKDDPIANCDLIDALTLGPIAGEEKIERLITIENVDLVERFLLNETVDGKNMEQYKTVYPIYFQISTFR
jgi:hypothetical protein